MSGLTKEQMLKYAAGYQMMALILSWYIGQFGIDTMPRFLFGVALLAVVLIMFLARDNSEKVAVAVSTIDDFVEKQKTKEPDLIETIADVVTRWLSENFKIPDSEHAVDEEKEDPKVW